MIRDKIEAEWINVGFLHPNHLFQYMLAAAMRREREVYYDQAET